MLTHCLFHNKLKTRLEKNLLRVSASLLLRVPQVDIVLRLDDAFMPSPEPLPTTGKYSLGPDMIFGWKPSNIEEIEKFKWNQRRKLKKLPESSFEEQEEKKKEPEQPKISLRQQRKERELNLKNLEKQVELLKQVRKQKKKPPKKSKIQIPFIKVEDDFARNRRGNLNDSQLTVNKSLLGSQSKLKTPSKSPSRGFFREGSRSRFRKKKDDQVDFVKPEDLVVQNQDDILMVNQSMIRDEYIDFVDDLLDDLEDLQEVDLMYQSLYNNSFKDIFSKVQFDPVVIIRNDPNLRPKSGWFFFSVKNLPHNQPVKFKIINIKEKLQSIKQREGIWSYSVRNNLNHAQEWMNNRCYDIKITKNRYFTQCMWSYTANQINDHTFFALYQPYTYSNLLTFINSKKIDPEERGFHYQKQVLCQCPGGLQVPIITIEDVKVRERRLGLVPRTKDDQKIKVILLIGRQTPADPFSSRMMEGFINFIVGDTEIAKRLRHRFIFKIVPMVCVDGVVLGNTITSILGVDMPNNWREPDLVKNPVAIELKRHMKNLEIQFQCQVFAFFDIKTAFSQSQTFFETLEYGNEDAFDRFLKISNVLLGVITIQTVFIDKNKTNFDQVKKIKQEKKEYESFLELTKRLNIPINNQFIELQKRQLLMAEDVSEEGLTGEILKYIKKTFEDLANYALTYNKIGKETDEADYDPDGDHDSPHSLSNLMKKKPRFSRLDLTYQQQMYRGKDFRIDLFAKKRPSQDSRLKPNTMLNISDEQRRAWQSKNASHILISKEGSKSKFTSHDYKEILNKTQNAEAFKFSYFKLTDIAKKSMTPFVKSPKDKANRYNILLRSSYMNDFFFSRIEENELYEKNFKQQQERTKSINNLINRLPAVIDKTPKHYRHLSQSQQGTN
ncbi:zinc carboxypeptidase family protein [Stylonychia lemnae]|uniref:Zinc carboxypeptidase family protein n=1 Tax=Stylonychia lemnae TaxID=5949 RepID=A0A077ZVF0_STYLE|nr:zinc carboxypeptidase family protein [Stylonychia lemnae]|eukprot:CDW73885.1 zinc carboxypeptidase family protein [Stylonychia lemnae]